MAMSDKDKQELAKEIIKQFLCYIDNYIGTSIRKKLGYIIIALIVAAGVSIGIIKIPGVLP